jgi:hypothetical protein
MPRVRITRACVAAGAVRGVGDVVDVPEAEAGLLLRLGKASDVSDTIPAPKDPADGPAPVAVSEPLAVVDGKPSHRRRR